MTEVLYVKRVKSLKARLVEEIKPEEIASKLCNMKCLNRREKENLLDIQKREGCQSHNARLLDILLRKDPNLFVWEKFVGVLEDTGNGTLAHLLRHEICEGATLSELDKRRLRSHHYDFVSGMEAPSVLRILYDADRYFSFSEKQELQSMRMSKDQADYLMTRVVQQGTYRHLSLLKKALQQTGQDTLASYIPIGEGKAAPQEHQLQYSGEQLEHPLLMNPDQSSTEKSDKDEGFFSDYPSTSNSNKKSGFESAVNGEDSAISVERTGQHSAKATDNTPSQQQIKVTCAVIFTMIEKKEYTPFDFWDMLVKSKRKNLIAPLKLVSEEGMNILQACVDKGRLAFLIHILHIGWWRILASQKVPQTSTSEHKGRTAKQIAESKKARKPLDEFNVYNELEGSLSSLMKACRTGDISKVKVLMATQTMETYHTDYNSANALYWAVVQGDLELIRFVEAQGLNVKMQTKKKETLLHLACTLGHAHLVESLVKTYNIEPFAVDTSHKAALDRVAENGDIKTLTAFVNCGIQPKPNSSALAAFAGRTAFIEHLFTKLNFPVDSTDMYSRTAMHRACESGKLTTVRLLMMKDADVTLVTAMGRNILHILAESGNMEILNLLLPMLKAKGILSEMIDTQDRYNGVDLCFLIRGRDKGRDAWHYVEVERNQVPIFLKKTKCGNVDVAKFGTVIKSGWGVNPDQDAVDDIEDTFKSRRLDKSALIDQTPLHIAVAKGNYEVARVLVEHGAALNIYDKFGLTPILLAASKGDLDMVTLLEKSGANFNAVTKKGLGMRDIADQNEHEAIVNYSGGRDYTHLLQNFLQGALGEVEQEMSQTKLHRLQEEKVDVKGHLTDTLRTTSIKINDFLQKLDSGPVMKETVGYTSQVGEKLAMACVSDSGYGHSVMSTGSSTESGYYTFNSTMESLVA